MDPKKNNKNDSQKKHCNFHIMALGADQTTNIKKFKVYVSPFRSFQKYEPFPGTKPLLSGKHGYLYKIRIEYEDEIDPHQIKIQVLSHSSESHQKMIDYALIDKNNLFVDFKIRFLFSSGKIRELFKLKVLYNDEEVYNSKKFKINARKVIK